MAYCVLADLEKMLPASALINLSNDIAGATSVNSAVIAEAIDQADREIDSYLSIAGYSVPCDPVPPIVTNLSIKMAIWNLHVRKYFDSSVWRKTYEDCQKLLEKIAEGKLTLGQLEDGVVVEGSGSHAVSSRTQKFTEEFMETF